MATDPSLPRILKPQSHHNTTQQQHALALNDFSQSDIIHPQDRLLASELAPLTPHLLRPLGLLLAHDHTVDVHNDLTRCVIADFKISELTEHLV